MAERYGHIGVVISADTSELSAGLKEANKRVRSLKGARRSGIKRVWKIFIRALFGVHSPSLRRRVKISDIWKEPNYER